MDRFGKITAKEAVELTGFTRQWLATLVRDGFVEKDEDGRYTVRALFRGLVKFYKDEARRANKSASAEDLDAERAKMLQLKREQLAGTLMLVDEHDAIGEEAVGIFRFGLATLPSRVSNDTNERRRVEGYCDEILADVAARFAKKAAEPEPPGDADEADPEDDAG